MKLLLRQEVQESLKEKDFGAGNVIIIGAKDQAKEPSMNQLSKNIYKVNNISNEYQLTGKSPQRQCFLNVLSERESPEPSQYVFSTSIKSI